MVLSCLQKHFECVYATSGAVFDLLLLLGIAVVGFLMRRHGVPLAPLMIGMVLGPFAETSLRDALLSSEGDWMIFLRSPIAVGIYLLLLVVLAFVVRARLKKPPQHDQAALAPADTDS